MYIYIYTYMYIYIYIYMIIWFYLILLGDWKQSLSQATLNSKAAPLAPKLAKGTSASASGSNAAKAIMVDRSGEDLKSDTNLWNQMDDQMVEV